MRKFLAVVKREYLKLVWTKAFIIGTLLAPFLSVGFAVIPALMFSIEGAATRVAIVDQNGKMFSSVSAALLTDKRREKKMRDAMGDLNQSQQEQIRRTSEQINAKFVVEETALNGKLLEQIKTELNERLREQKLDAYIVIPANLDAENYELFARNTSDFVLQSRIEDALNTAVRETRMSAANISPEKLDEINREVTIKTTRVSETGEARDSGESFFVAFAAGLLIYLVLIIYGQSILGAVVEEKETRIAEILFSSARPFTLMMGKLVGVGLVAFTQLAIWILSGAALAIYGLSMLSSSGIDIPAPNISAAFIISLFVFFLLGFFTYATIYALIGSMVTTVQEGGQFAFPPILLLMIGFYCSFPVIRNPDSDFAVWTSVLPFLSPIVMPVRMFVQMPPLWQILLSFFLSLLTIFVLTWVAARAYRIGMLMNGKKATIPELIRWIRQP
jgi:ABC-2 type transport system permease protein